MTRKSSYVLLGFAVMASLAFVIHLRTHSVARALANASALLGDEQVHEAPRQSTARSTFAALNHPDIRPEHRQLIDETLRALPSGCRWALKNFYVRYDGSVSRALGGSESIILNGNVSDNELRALFIHEFGHITALGCFVGDPQSGPSGFRDGKRIIDADNPGVEFYQISWTSENVQRRGTRTKDFVSGYAAWDIHEDFAETFAYRALHHEAFIERAKTNDALRKKLAWMDTHVFTDDTPMATGLAPWTGKIPWDVTLLPYDWKEDKTWAGL